MKKIAYKGSLSRISVPVFISLISRRLQNLGLSLFLFLPLLVSCFLDFDLYSLAQFIPPSRFSICPSLRRFPSPQADSACSSLLATGTSVISVSRNRRNPGTSSFGGFETYSIKHTHTSSHWHACDRFFLRLNLIYPIPPFGRSICERITRGGGEYRPHAFRTWSVHRTFSGRTRINILLT